MCSPGQFPRGLTHTQLLAIPPSSSAGCPAPTLFGERMNKRGIFATTVCSIACCPSHIPAGIVLQFQTGYPSLTLSWRGNPSLTICTGNFYCPAVGRSFWVVVSVQVAGGGLRRVLLLLGLQTLSQFYIAEQGEGSFN